MPADTSVNKHYLLPISIITAAFGLAALSFLFPVTSSTYSLTATHTRAAISIAITVLFMASAFVFLSLGASFRARLRTAYRLMAFGMLSLSLSVSQLIIWGLGDLWESAWAISGSGMVPYSASTFLIYLGMRRFCQLLDIRGFATSVLRVSIVAFVIAIITGIAGTYWVQYEAPGTNTYIAVCSWGVVYIWFAILLSLRVSRAMGSHYQKAMNWLVASTVMMFIAYLHETVGAFFFSNHHPYIVYGAYLIPALLAGLTTVGVAYQLRILPALGGTDGTQGLTVNDATDQDFIDSIVAVASLAPHSQTIDNMLDPLREVTASHRKEQGKGIDPQEKKQLMETYYSLESYLIHNDPIRALSREQIRSYVTPAFYAVLETDKNTHNI